MTPAHSDRHKCARPELRREEFVVGSQTRCVFEKKRQRGMSRRDAKRGKAAGSSASAGCSRKGSNGSMSLVCDASQLFIGSSLFYAPRPQTWLVLSLPRSHSYPHTHPHAHTHSSTRARTLPCTLAVRMEDVRKGGRRRRRRVYVMADQPIIEA
jgi:hypothetical protein